MLRLDCVREEGVRLAWHQVVHVEAQGSLHAHDERGLGEVLAHLRSDRRVLGRRVCASVGRLQQHTHPLQHQLAHMRRCQRRSSLPQVDGLASDAEHRPELAGRARGQLVPARLEHQSRREEAAARQCQPRQVQQIARQHGRRVEQTMEAAGGEGVGSSPDRRVQLARKVVSVNLRRKVWHQVSSTGRTPASSHCLHPATQSPVGCSNASPCLRACVSADPSGTVAVTFASPLRRGWLLPWPRKGRPCQRPTSTTRTEQARSVGRSDSRAPLTRHAMTATGSGPIGSGTNCPSKAGPPSQTSPDLAPDLLSLGQQLFQPVAPGTEADKSRQVLMAQEGRQTGKRKPPIDKATDTVSLAMRSAHNWPKSVN
ncbi:unnamed protein product [Protopolystoma xenopodis]|uniref:Uncharacterized protein n=1 Tax=Protopolystoma xenopodis TaxID=117903 RepID=A0A448XIS1_9PLAT|nr:unnamed protein product [Protopolystoma xenopodis]